MLFIKLGYLVKDTRRISSVDLVNRNCQMMVVHLIQSLTIPTHHFVFSATSKARQVGHLWLLLLNVTFTIPIMVLIFVILTLFDFLKIFWIFLEIFDEILFEFFFVILICTVTNEETWMRKLYFCEKLYCHLETKKSPVVIISRFVLTRKYINVQNVVSAVSDRFLKQRLLYVSKLMIELNEN